VTTLEVVLKLRRGVLVSGRVIDEAGKPVAEALVTAPSADTAWGSGAEGHATTDAKGAYQLTLAPGNYRVVGSADDFAPSTSALFAVATAPMTAPDLTLRAGGVLVGMVVSEAGAPVPFATVRVGEVRPGLDGSRVRGNTADATGRFEVRSLARTTLKATAEHDGVASAVVDVDLSTAARRDDLELVLDVAGTIAGVVVDSAGQPVAETTVTAVPDFLKGGTFDRMMLTGPSTAATDGSGAFVLRGLADGDYRISARREGGRMDFGMGAGVGAHTGATGVRVVLATPGRVVATLELAGGGAPTTARASVAMQPPVLVASGKLVMEDVEPGAVDLRLTGPEFGEHAVRNVVIKPGETTDLGTIKLPVPRTLRGKVVDAGGAPVAGAKVSVGRFLVSGGTFDDDSSEEDGDAGDPWSRSGRTARSGSDGSFVIVGVPPRESQVAAETATAVSLSATIPPGVGDPPAMTLVVQPAGGLAGKVTRGGQPVDGVQVSVVPKAAAGGQMSEVSAGPDGTYRFERLPAGPATVRTLKLGADMNMVSHTVDVTIVAGRVTNLDIDMPAAGNVTLTVTIQGKGGAAIPSAQVILMRGLVAYKNGKEAMEGTMSGGSMVGVGFAVGGGSTPFKDLAPGTYSVCTVPLPGDMSDTQMMARLGEHMDIIAVHCARVDVAAAPASQAFTHEVPPAAPLPAE
jgi:protocatechuate 3,4-dioxygenase beta subunit